MSDLILRALQEVLEPSRIHTDRETVTFFARDALPPERLPPGLVPERSIPIRPYQGNQDRTQARRVGFLRAAARREGDAGAMDRVRRRKQEIVSHAEDESETQDHQGARRCLLPS